MALREAIEILFGFVDMIDYQIINEIDFEEAWLYLLEELEWSLKPLHTFITDTGELNNTSAVLECSLYGVEQKLEDIRGVLDSYNSGDLINIEASITFWLPRLYILDQIQTIYRKIQGYFIANDIQSIKDMYPELDDLRQDINIFKNVEVFPGTKLITGVIVAEYALPFLDRIKLAVDLIERNENARKIQQWWRNLLSNPTSNLNNPHNSIGYRRIAEKAGYN